MPHSEPVNGSSTNGPRPERRGVYLLTHPRSASNLFQRMMEAQPGVQGSGYQFFNAAFPMMMSMEKGPLSSFPEAEREALYAPYQEAFKAAKAELDGAKAKVSKFRILERICVRKNMDEVEKRSEVVFCCIEAADSRLYRTIACSTKLLASPETTR